MVRSKIKKDGIYGFYEGRRKATDAEIKAFIKLDHDAINASILPKEYKKYLGAVKGGKSRAQNALSLSNGRFLPKNIQDKALQNLGVNIEQIRKEKGLKTLREVFKGNTSLQKSLDKLISDTGTELWYNEQKTEDKIKTYRGQNIYLNGKLIEKTQALAALRKYCNKMKRKYDLYFPGIAFKLKYKGVDNLYLTIDNDVYENGVDSDTVQLYHANK